jgi:phage shock protein C
VFITQGRRIWCDCIVPGICGGLGEITKTDPTIIRLLFVFVALATAVAPMIITYIIGWIIIPLKPPAGIP